MATTHRNATRAEVFEKIANPPSRLVSLWPVSNLAFDAWERQALLPDEFNGVLKVWPVEAALLKGIQLDGDQNFESWYADLCVNGLRNGDQKLVEAVAEMLSLSVGIVLRPPGELTTLIVSEDYFDRCVKIGDSKLVSRAAMDRAASGERAEFN